VHVYTFEYLSSRIRNVNESANSLAAGLLEARHRMLPHLSFSPVQSGTSQAASTLEDREKFPYGKSFSPKNVIKSWIL